MIQIEQFLNNKPLYEAGDYYTNCEFLVKKDLCLKNPETKVIALALKDIDSQFEYYKYLDWKEAKDNNVTVVLNDRYCDLLEILEADTNIKTYSANKYAPLKLMKGDEIIAMFMGCAPTLSEEQEKLLMINNFAAYCNYRSLVPVEYQMVGDTGMRGIFLPFSLTDEEIKRCIQKHIKISGGRWFGKFERRPDLLKEYANKIIEKMEQSDKAKILSKMNQSEQ